MFFVKNLRGSLAKILTRRIFIICFVSNFLLILILFFWLKYELSLKDQDIARIRFHEVIEVVEHEGIHFLNSNVERDEFSGMDNLLIQVFDNHGKLVVDKKPSRMHYFSKESVENAIRYSFRHLGKNTIYPRRFGQETIEIFSGKMDQYTIIVGINTDASEDFVNLFGHNALILMIFTALFISWISYYFVKNALTPVHNLISTIKDIREGRLESFTPEPSSNDEVSQLSFLFNQMISDIVKLVGSLQSSLDSIAHDLRTPLMHLRVKIEDLSVRNKKKGLTFEALNELLDETQKIETYLTQLLEISQATSGGVALKKEEISLKKSIEEILDIYEYVIEEHELTVVNSITNVSVFGDKNKLKRIIANLLDNAIKYGKKISGRIEFSTHKNNDGSMDFVISDDGIGIPEEEFSRIWERLYRVESSRTSDGAGLGLSLVKSLVEAHGWKIRVESKVGFGSRFIITIF